MERSRNNDRKKEKHLIWNCHVTMTKNDAYKSNEMHLRNHALNSIDKNKSLLSATSFLYRSPMAYNTTASLDKLTCTDYVDFGKCQDKFGHSFLVQKQFVYLDVKLKVFKKVTTMSSDWFKITQWQKRISTSLCDERISWSLKQKTSLERKTCPQF